MEVTQAKKKAEAMAVVLISQGATVRVPYSEHYGIYLTLSLHSMEWEGEAGEGGMKYADRLQHCAMNLEIMQKHVPEGVFKDGLEIAEALLLLSHMDEYIPDEEYLSDDDD